jgi:YVTN family beta-propeller protein
MNNAAGRILKIALLSVGAVALLAISVGAYLIYPGTPSTSATLKFEGYVPLPSDATLSVMDYLTIDRDRLFITGESTGDLYRVKLSRNSLATVADVSKLAGQPATHGVVIDPSSHLGFATRGEANTVDVFDPVKMTVMKRIPVANGPDAIFYDPFEKLVYVASGDADLATLIDPATQTVIATIALGGEPEYAALDPSTQLLYQNLHDTSTVAAVDIAKRAVVQSWPLQGCQAPSGMAIDASHHRLFIGCNAKSVLAIFDLSEHRVVATVPVGKNPDSVVFDPELRRIYTTGKSGILSVIQQEEPSKYETIDTVHLHYGAHTLTLDPVTHTVYVAYAGLLVNPRVAVFNPRPAALTH